MNARVKVIRQLLAESRYVVDEAAVAEAMLLRASVRRAVPELDFRAGTSPRVRSLHREDNALPFRGSGAPRLRSPSH